MTKKTIEIVCDGITYTFTVAPGVLVFDIDGVIANNLFMMLNTRQGFEEDAEKPTLDSRNFFFVKLNPGEEDLSQAAILAKRLQQTIEDPAIYSKTDFYVRFPKEWETFFKILIANKIKIYCGSQRVYMPETRDHLSAFFQHAFPAVAEHLNANLAKVMAKVPVVGENDSVSSDKNAFLTAVEKAENCKPENLLLIDDDPSDKYQRVTLEHNSQFYHVKGTRPGATPEACFRYPELVKLHLELLLRFIEPNILMVSLLKHQDEPHALALLNLLNKQFVSDIIDNKDGQASRLSQTLPKILSNILSYVKNHSALLQADESIQATENSVLANIHRHIISTIMSELRPLPKFVADMLTECKKQRTIITTGTVSTGPEITFFFKHYIAPLFQHIDALKEKFPDSAAELTAENCAILRKIGNSLTTFDYFNPAPREGRSSAFYLLQEEPIKPAIRDWDAINRNLSTTSSSSIAIAEELKFTYTIGLSGNSRAFIAERLRLADKPDTIIDAVYTTAESTNEHGAIIAFRYRDEHGKHKYVTANGTLATIGLSVATLGDLQLAPIMHYTAQNEGRLEVTFVAQNVFLHTHKVNNQATVHAGFNQQNTPNPHQSATEHETLEVVVATDHAPKTRVFPLFLAKIGAILDERDLIGERRALLVALYNQIESWADIENVLHERHRVLQENSERNGEEDAEYKMLNEVLSMITLLTDESLKEVQPPPAYQRWWDAFLQLFPSGAATALFARANHAFNASSPQPSEADDILLTDFGVIAFQNNAKMGNAMYSLGTDAAALTLIVSVYMLGKTLWSWIKPKNSFTSTELSNVEIKQVKAALRQQSHLISRVCQLIEYNNQKAKLPVSLVALSNAFSQFKEYVNNVTITSSDSTEIVIAGSKAETGIAVNQAITLTPSYSQKGSLQSHLNQMRAEQRLQPFTYWLSLGVFIAAIGLVIKALTKIASAKLSEGTLENESEFFDDCLEANVKGNVFAPTLFQALLLLSIATLIHQVAKLGVKYIPFDFFSASKSSAIAQTQQVTADENYDDGLDARLV